MSLMERQIYALWMGKQSARGTPNTTPTHRFKHLGGGALQTNPEYGSETFSDATQFVDTYDWLNKLGGAGAPPISATPEELASILWVAHGGETTTAVTGPPAKTRHTFVPLPGLGHWSSWAQRQGSSVIDRTRFDDVMIGQFVVEGSTANKSVRITPSLVSLDPGVVLASDPTAVMPTKGGFLYTDGTSRFNVDGAVMRGHTQFTLTVNFDLQPVDTDDVTVYDFAIGNASVTLGVAAVMDAAGKAWWNQKVYGTTSPAANTKPLRSIPLPGSYAFDLRARDSTGAVNGDKFVFTCPSVRWTVPDAPEPDPQGGASELALSGSMRKTAGQPGYQIDIDCDAAAFTV